MVAGVLRQRTVCVMQQGSDILFPLLSLTMRDGPGPATATSASAPHLQRGLSWPELVTANSDYMQGEQGTISTHYLLYLPTIYSTYPRSTLSTHCLLYLPTIYSIYPLTTLSTNYLLFTLTIYTNSGEYSRDPSVTRHVLTLQTLLSMENRLNIFLLDNYMKVKIILSINVNELSFSTDT